MSKTVCTLLAGLAIALGAWALTRVGRTEEPVAAARAAAVEGAAGAADVALGTTGADGPAARLERVELGPETRTALRAGAAASLVLRLVDAAGRPARGAVASLGAHGAHDGPCDDAPREVVADASGAVRVDGLATGRALVLVCGGEGWVARELPLAAAMPGEERALGDVVLARGHDVVGVVVARGEPVEGARVALERPMGSFHVALDEDGAAAERPRVTTTDARGRFALRGVAEGVYDLTARRADLATTFVEGLRAPAERELRVEMDAGLVVAGRVLDAGGRPLAGAVAARVPVLGPPTAVEARAALDERAASCGEGGRFALSGFQPGLPVVVAVAAPGHALAARVAELGQEVDFTLAPAADLGGRVLDAAGRAAPDVEVHVAPLDAQDAEWTYDRRSRTDADGTFRLSALPAGAYRVEARGAAGRAAIERAEVDAGLAPLELRLAAGRALVVRVVDEVGAPLPSAEVELEAAGDPFAGQGLVILGENLAVLPETHDAEVLRARADAAGEARFADLDPGAFVARARAAGFAAVERAVDVVGSEGETLELVLTRPGALVVRVVDASGAPAPGAGVRLARADGTSERRAEADALGLLAWDDLEPGDHELVHVLRGTPPAWLAGLTGGARGTAEPSRRAVRVVAGEVAQVELVLAAEAVVRVHVTRAGRAVAGAEVLLADRSGAYPWQLVGMEGAARTDARGEAVLPPAAPGAYTLCARGAPDRPMTTEVLELGPGARAIALELAGGSVHGTIASREGGPLPDALVRLVPHDFAGQGQLVLGVDLGEAMDAADPEGAAPRTFTVGEVAAYPAADGRFEFEDVPPGAYELRVECPGYGPWSSAALDVRDGDVVDAGHARLVPACRLRGRVVGLPAGVTGAALQLRSLSGEHVGLEAIDAESHYEFTRLAPGVYLPVVQYGEEQREAEQVSVSPDRDNSHDIVLR